MHSIQNRILDFRRVLAVVVSCVLLLAAGCASKPPGPAASFDLTPFKEMAKSAGCADISNRLFLIDGQQVFWEISGNCADGAYAQTLFGATVDDVLCNKHDSIAGPQGDCQAAYQAMFDIMVANLDKPDLGLGAGHTVEQIPF